MVRLIIQKLKKRGQSRFKLKNELRGFERPQLKHFCYDICSYLKLLEVASILQNHKIQPFSSQNSTLIYWSRIHKSCSSNQYKFICSLELIQLSFTANSIALVFQNKNIDSTFSTQKFERGHFPTVLHDVFCLFSISNHSKTQPNKSTLSESLLKQSNYKSHKRTNGNLFRLLINMFKFQKLGKFMPSDETISEIVGTLLKDCYKGWQGALSKENALGGFKKLGMQFQFIKINLYRKTPEENGNFKITQFFSNPFNVWTQSVSPYQCFYFTPYLAPQNYLFSDFSQNILEEPILKAKNFVQAQPNLKHQSKQLKCQQSAENVLAESSKHLTTSLFQNSKKLKKAMTNHNVLPNIMNTMLSFIRRRNKTGKIVEKIMNKQKANGNVTEKSLSKYYAYEIYLHSKIPKSKHQSSLRFIVNHLDPTLDAFSIEEQLLYNKVCRILIFELLSQEFLLTFLTTRKCTKTSKADHLKARRFIAALLKQGLESQEVSNSF